MIEGGECGPLTLLLDDQPLLRTAPKLMLDLRMHWYIKTISHRLIITSFDPLLPICLKML